MLRTYTRAGRATPFDAEDVARFLRAAGIAIGPGGYASYVTATGAVVVVDVDMTDAELADALAAYRATPTPEETQRAQRIDLLRQYVVAVEGGQVPTDRQTAVVLSTLIRLLASELPELRT